MIELTKMDGRKMLLNEAVIEMVEETPDTVIRLTTGNKYIIKETARDVMDKIEAYQHTIRA